jgi:hypothetical protein
MALEAQIRLQGSSGKEIRIRSQTNSTDLPWILSHIA